MSGWQMWVGSIGALAAIISQWWGMNYYLAAIGGVLALIALWVK